MAEPLIARYLRACTHTLFKGLYTNTHHLRSDIHTQVFKGIHTQMAEPLTICVYRPSNTYSVGVDPVGGVLNVTPDARDPRVTTAGTPCTPLHPPPTPLTHPTQYPQHSGDWWR